MYFGLQSGVNIADGLSPSCIRTDVGINFHIGSIDLFDVKQLFWMARVLHFETWETEWWIRNNVHNTKSPSIEALIGVWLGLEQGMFQLFIIEYRNECSYIHIQAVSYLRN